MRLGVFLLAILCLSVQPLAAKKPLGVGDMAPDILGYAVDKEPISRDQFEGRVVVMTFWATWCPPCLKELPILARMADLTDDEDLAVVAVGYRQGRSVTKKVVRKIGDDTEIVFAYDRRKKLERAFEVKAIPNLWIIGRDGRILFNKTGYGEAALDGLVDVVNAALMGLPIPGDAQEPAR